MASTFACLGLDVADDESGFQTFVGGLAERAKPVGRFGDVAVVRWQDPSGVRLTFTIEGNRIVDFVPGFEGPAGARISSVRPVYESVVQVSVDDAAGEQQTAMAVELEQRYLLPAWPDVSGAAAVTALGVDVTVHPDAESFEASEDSLLSRGPVSEAEPDPPLRVGAESFFSYGVFGGVVSDPEEVGSHARLSGVVLESERRVVHETDQEIVLARVRTVGFEANLCLPGSSQDLPAGSVVSGTVWLSAFLTAPPRLPGQRWWRRR